MPLTWTRPWLLEEPFGPCRGDTGKCTGYLATCVPCWYWAKQSRKLPKA